MEPNELDHGGHPFQPYVQALQELGAAKHSTIACRRFPIRDCSVPNVESMKRILDEIDLAVTGGMTVYVHCWGGRGRTGTVIGCHLVRHRLVPAGEALAMLGALTQHQRPAFGQLPETAEQRSFVKAWRPGQ